MRNQGLAARPGPTYKTSVPTIHFARRTGCHRAQFTPAEGALAQARKLLILNNGVPAAGPPGGVFQALGAESNPCPDSDKHLTCQRKQA